MRIAVTGATGLVGSTLSESLQSDGHEVVAVVRRNAQPNQIQWDPAAGQLKAEDLAGIDVVVHLAGENIAKGRWNAEKKRRIRDSRVQGTRLMSTTLAGLEEKPKAYIVASAIGYYGDQQSTPQNESAPAGSDFLADVCREWEEASEPARDAGIRTVNTRIGVVLSTEGGALEAMLTPFRMGVGGIVGSGSQVWSWISIQDVVGAIRHIMDHEDLDGPVNLTSPNPSTNAEFTKTLGHVLGRPTILPMPAFAARLLLGEMADALLLSSSCVVPEKLLQSGYEFQHEHLEAALHALLK